ncbi:MAG: EAL domain-containing protein, partial [Bacillota bacterium]|nr:EAL domain-containing protein [Bacillota bacterium]
FEALVRWQSPELGLVSPVNFINIAEETGFITSLGSWILEESCSYAAKLNRQSSCDYRMSVNISVIQLLQEEFNQIVFNVLETTGLAPALLELEITESIIMESPNIIIKKLRQLRDYGINIAIDDFGTGYSSLAYLRNMPITTLKVDKVFIDDISSDNSNTVLADSIITLGHKLSLSIVAEGVETELQRRYLEEHDCDKIQGYLFSKPLPPSDLEKLLKSKN